MKNVRAAFLGTIAVAFALVAGIALLRPAEGNVDTGISRMEFWWLKVHAEPVYDVVVGGDSRIMIDIDPAAMDAILGGRTLNFGFNFAGYSQRYLDALAAKLRRRDGQGTVVLGITPRSLTPLNMKASTFEEEVDRSPWEQFLQRHLGDFFEAVRPVSLSSIFAGFRGRNIYYNHYDNGFMSLEFVPPEPDQDLPTYQKVFINNQVSAPHIDNLIGQVARWRNDGLRVFGFFPPTSPAIAEAEQLSGFDRKAFVARFTSAGGQWIDDAKADWIFADGSHLSAGETAAYSRDLAKSILAAR